MSQLDRKALKSFYLPQIALQCGYALIAADDIERSLQSGRVTDSLRLYYSINNFLTFTARVSKLLWPSSERDKEKKSVMERRCKSLRQMLSVEETSPLKSRAVRNYLDHIDGKLDDWVSYPAQASGAKVLPSVVTFNLGMRTLMVGGESVSIPPMVAAIRALQERLALSNREDEIRAK